MWLAISLATGYGLLYMTEEMLKCNGKDIKGKTIAVSGSGNVAIYAIQKAQQLGGKPVTCSDSTGWIYDPEGIDVALLKEVKEVNRARLTEYAAKRPSAQYHDKATEGTNQWGVTVPGHMQRGGAPDPYDRVFASRLGAEAGTLILKKEYGYMVAYKNREIVKVPLKDIAGKLKYVSPDASIIKEAKLLGVCFGD